MDYIADIKGSDPLEPEWGERFRSWYMTKVFTRKEKYSLPDDLSCDLNVFHFQYRFIMPPTIEFSKGFDDAGKIVYGVINYSEAERLLGVFRFPLDTAGFFAAPIPAKETMKSVKNLTEDQVKDLINEKKVLTFEAFRIPYFGFEFFYITDSNFDLIGKLVSPTFAYHLRDNYLEEMKQKVNEVKSKVSALPNYLLILENVLGLYWKNEKEVLTMSGGIIHFGA